MRIMHLFVVHVDNCSLTNNTWSHTFRRQKVSVACGRSQEVFLERKGIIVQFCVMVDIISAVQSKVPLAPLPKKSIKRSKNHQLSTRKYFKRVVFPGSFQIILMISAFQSCEFECVVCLFAYIVWSLNILFVSYYGLFSPYIFTVK